MDIYILKEINVLGSGEQEYYCDVYESKEKAIEAMKNDAEEHMENGAEITDGKFGEAYVRLENKEYENVYTFEIEYSVVK
ncbi:hypothetical protein IMZ31_23540 (plasmid) [Pontibacillus sp. ALD_SL1]|uniref:hypothetical protein n=1 Tax=Pontibacillus sp. ALD_SL1 TaxID=2777185 RepID=UPI001A972B1E|nr:hypothetical protein [Pontibacillus sp. ALD_SL1]QST02426.1 hypothetical protein IMZ31_23540 [Pontibacillus sp. ALD_SL1]